MGNRISLATRVARLEEAASIGRDPVTVVIDTGGTGLEGVMCAGKFYQLHERETQEKLVARVEREARKALGPSAALTMFLCKARGGLNLRDRAVA